MTSLRALVRRHRTLAVVVLALALLMKIVVPAGYMPMASGGVVTIQICSGQASAPMAMAMPGMPGMPGDRDHHAPIGKADQPCAFSGLAAPSLAAADPILLAGAIAFVLAIAMRIVVARVPVVAVRLRPPLRAPPRPA